MTRLENRINAFTRLGALLQQAAKPGKPAEEAIKNPLMKDFGDACVRAVDNNPWFTNASIALAIQNLAKMLSHDKLWRWVQAYPALRQTRPSKTIAVVMAGNIPLVGFHDFLSVLISGHRFIGKLSSNDRHLLPAVSQLLTSFAPSLRPHICFTQELPHVFDAAIATGSDNSARYFEYNFRSCPHLIRKNRSGLAIISGHENEAALTRLAADVFTFFGLGCRNVSKIYLPKGFTPEKLFSAFRVYEGALLSHAGYRNNYRYNKALLRMNVKDFSDNGFSLFVPNESIHAPVSVVHYTYYASKQSLATALEAHADEIQCIVSDKAWWPGSFDFGQAQEPELHDYADGVDTMRWLTEL